MQLLRQYYVNYDVKSCKALVGFDERHARSTHVEVFQHLSWRLELTGVRNAAELTAAVNSGNGSRALVFRADSVDIVFSIYPLHSTHGTEPTDKLHVVTTATATSLLPSPAKRTKDILDEQLGEQLGIPPVVVAEASVESLECGGWISVSESDICFFV